MLPGMLATTYCCVVVVIPQSTVRSDFFYPFEGCHHNWHVFASNKDENKIQLL
jgi:hypothetical protein